MNGTSRPGRIDPARVGVRQVAERAGVSTQTVSRVINDHPHIRPETRERVLAAMAELDGVEAAALGEWSAQWSPEPQRRLIYGLVVSLLQEGLTGDPDKDRGLYSSLAHMQAQAGQIGAALVTLEDAVSEFPKEFTFHHALSGLLGELNQLDRALESARLAHSHAYGDNLLRAVHREAQALSTLDRTDEALALLAETLKTTERPPKELEVRTHRYLDQLLELQQELTPAD